MCLATIHSLFSDLPLTGTPSPYKKPCLASKTAMIRRCKPDLPNTCDTAAIPLENQLAYMSGDFSISA